MISYSSESFAILIVSLFFADELPVFAKPFVGDLHEIKNAADKNNKNIFIAIIISNLPVNSHF